MPSQWAFVDQPVSAPGVLLDMNNGTTWRTLGENFNISPPPLRRSIVNNAMSDGGFLTAAAYELREITFTLQLEGATEAARSAQLKAFEAQVAKPSNLLMYRAETATAPVFFRTLRSDTFELDTQFVPGRAWRIRATLLAEPFALGTRIDFPAVNVSNNPAGGANPTRLDLTGIIGDAPAPAFVRISNLGAATSVMLAQRTVNNPEAVTVFAQTESAVMGADTATWAGDANFSGSGNRATATTFANNGLTDRLTFTLPTATMSAALRGRYRVFLRGYVAASFTPTTYRIRFRQVGADTAHGPNVQATIPNGSFRLIDLGVMEFPHATAAPVTVGYSGLPAGFATSQLAIQAQRVTGNGNLDLDYVYLMPVDERFCVVYQVASSGFLILDGPNDATYCMAAGTTPFGATRTVDNGGGLVPRIGGLPLLVPGVLNRWHMITDTGTVANSKTVEVSYWPRWREIAA